MSYDLGVLALFVNLARSHVFRIGFSTRTVCCEVRGARFFVVRSLYDLVTSCRFWINAFTFPLDRDEMAGRFDVYLPKSRSSQGDGRLCYIGVLTRFNRIAIQGTPQMAVDTEAISLSRVYSYITILSVTCPYTKCNPSYLDTCLFCS